MKKSFLIPAMMLLFTALLTTCKKTTTEVLPDEPVPIALTADQISLISSGKSFAFDLFRKVADASVESENIIISPLSISVALSMATNGANGETQNEMLETLRSGNLTTEAINESYRKLSEALLSVDKRVLISIANSVWTEDNFPAKKQFIDILKEYYSAEGRAFDINDPGVPDEINGWIEDKTNGLIKDMLDDLDPQTVMLLVNAIYFKGQWNSQFDKDKTDPEPFYKTESASADVPMMKQKNKFRTYRGADFTFAEFPYGQGNFVMDVIVPDEITGVNNIIRTITDESFNQMTESMFSREIELSFPRFKYGYKKELKEILKDMGMGIAFTGMADFSNISDIAIYISFVLHQAFIETNEEGTEAAAATVIGFETTSMPPQPAVLKLDRPFFYIIRETTTNSILFMGRVSDPLAE